MVRGSRITDNEDSVEGVFFAPQAGWELAAAAEDPDTGYTSTVILNKSEADGEDESVLVHMYKVQGRTRLSIVRAGSAFDQNRCGTA